MINVKKKEKCWFNKLSIVECLLSGSRWSETSFIRKQVSKINFYARHSLLKTLTTWVVNRYACCTPISQFLGLHCHKKLQFLKIKWEFFTDNWIHLGCSLENNLLHFVFLVIFLSNFRTNELIPYIHSSESIPYSVVIYLYINTEWCW